MTKPFKSHGTFLFELLKLNYNISDLLLEMALNWIFFKEGGGQEEQVKKWKKAE